MNNYSRGNRTGFNADRDPDDFYPTPPCATKALLACEKFEGAIWEPACGTGDMAKVLAAAGHEVVATDLIDRGYGEGNRDFLCEWNSLAPNIVTNPPFKWARAFAERSLMLTSGKVALFLRLAFLEGQERGRWFPSTPLARVYVMSRRVPIRKGRLAEDSEREGPLAFAWFVWDHAHRGEPALHFLDWANPRSSSGRSA